MAEASREAGRVALRWWRWWPGWIGYVAAAWSLASSVRFSARGSLALRTGRRSPPSCCGRCGEPRSARPRSPTISVGAASASTAADCNGPDRGKAVVNPKERGSETRGANRKNKSNRVLGHPGVPVGDDDPFRCHRDGDVHGVPQRLPRPPSVARTRVGVHVREGSERLLPAPRVPLLNVRPRSNFLVFYGGSDGYLADKGSSSAQEESSTRSTVMPSR